MSLYQEFLTEVLAHQLPGIVHIIAIPQFEANREWSEYWVKCHIYRKLYSCISKLPLLETACGKQSLGHPLVYLLQGDTTEEIEGLKKLLEPIRNIYYALGTEDWYGAFLDTDRRRIRYFLWKTAGEGRNFYTEEISFRE